MTKIKLNLAEVQSRGIERFDWRHILTAKDGKTIEEVLSATDIETLDTYFSVFAEPISLASMHFGLPLRCIGCQLILEGGILGFLIGGQEDRTTLDWGLAHGEAFCKKCDWPYRIYHRNVGPIEFISFALPYHPGEVN